MRSRSPFISALRACSLAALSVLASRACAADQASDIPAWLAAHVGEAEGQITRTILDRARALHARKLGEGAIRNPCYFAMDATRPNDLGEGRLGRRFYVVCEADRSFRAIPAGHGSGRDLDGVADFANGRRCARNFGNALDSELTTGGAYTTAEVKASFKGYYRAAAGRDVPFLRSFVQFEGEGETANARQRAIGGHAAVTLKGVCLRRGPGDPHASLDGYVRFGTLVDYAGGRSNGCTSWSPSDVPQIVSLIKDEPTTLYIYPEAADIDAVARAVATGRPLAQAGPYWSAACLKEVRSPRFWSRQTLEPMLADYGRRHPAPPARPVPICKEP